jgi:hypothetical protein
LSIASSSQGGPYNKGLALSSPYSFCLPQTVPFPCCCFRFSVGFSFDPFFGHFAHCPFESSHRQRHSLVFGFTTARGLR